jgi:hypothetical protein
MYPLLNIFLLLLITMFAYAGIGMALFWNVAYGNSVDAYTNFRCLPTPTSNFLTRAGILGRQ